MMVNEATGFGRAETMADFQAANEGRSPLRSIAAHVLTALVTVGVVMLLVRDRMGSLRPEPVAQIPRRQQQNIDNRPREVPTNYTLPAVPAPALPADLLNRVEADEQINIRIYEAVNRSVVNITAAESGGLFGEEETSGTASGFVIDRQGYILTNFHVVEGAEALRVTLFDGSTHNCEVVGRDPSNDVAVARIHVPAARLTPVAFGDSSKLLVGQKVLALGNPFGLERTLTTGIISSLDRTMRARNGRMIKGVIQTDAAINPGNSGGPLLNTRGEVIGMNTAIVSNVGQSAGISFAVPINAIQRILKPLIEHGRVIRADLGVRRVLTTDAGLLVVELLDGGPASRAGILPMSTRVERLGPYIVRRPDPESADVIEAVNGKPVKSVDDLLNEVESHAPGDVVTVTVIRGGRPRDIKVTLGRS
jgi:S1-C subfamily serine protease